MAHRYRAFVLCLSTAATACVATPLHDGPTISRAQAVTSIKCQLKYAVWTSSKPHKWLRDWTPLVALTLKEVNADGSTIGAGLAVPLTPGLMTVSLNGKANGRATRTAATEFFIDLQTLDKYDCRDHHNAQTHPIRRTQILAKDLLFDEEFKRLDHSIDAIGALPKSHNYTVDFMIKLTGDLGPGFTMIPISNDTFGGSFKFDGEKSDTHTLKLTLTPPAPEKKLEPIEVVIVGDQTIVAADGEAEAVESEGRRTKRIRGKTASGVVQRRARARREAVDAQVRDTLRNIQSEVEDLRQ